MHRAGETSGDKVEERPKCAKKEFNFEPWNLVELLHDVEQVEAKENTGEPESDHGDPAEVGAFRDISKAGA